ncbi:L-tartrate utilization transcriptional activator TtdR [Escherichia coli]
MLNSWPLAKDLQVLVEIVHSGSFSAAAATLGQTPAFVTKRIQILENTLATTLLNRSARGVALTESGQRCYEHALESLPNISDWSMTSRKSKRARRESYWLVVFGFGRSHIAPAITELMRNYPELQVHFELFDWQIDLVQDNIDLDIRINENEIPDYYIAHLLTKNKRILCAAPEYLQKYPQPQSLQELSRHDCLVTKERDMTHGIWELGNGQEKKSVKVSGHLSSNSGEIVLQWALEGKGIMLRSEWDVLPFLESGKLGASIAGVMHKAPISGLFTGSRSIAA